MSIRLAAGELRSRPLGPGVLARRAAHTELPQALRRRGLPGLDWGESRQVVAGIRGPAKAQIVLCARRRMLLRFPSLWPGRLRSGDHELLSVITVIHPLWMRRQ
jgi:hypothetical protein